MLSNHRWILTTNLLLIVFLSMGCQPATDNLPEAKSQSTVTSEETKQSAKQNNFSNAPVCILVMDPLAMPLSCQCVKGLGQRRYDSAGKMVAGKNESPRRSCLR